jgi:hypothetical protein
MPVADDPGPSALADTMARLPRVYSLALRLRAAGISGPLLAECLAVEPEAIGPLLEIADAKLAALLGTEPDRLSGR